MLEDYYGLAVIAIIALLFLWLVYRLRNLVRFMVKNEIFDNLPSIKTSIDNFDHRLLNLTAQIELLERKLKEISDKMGKI